MDITAILRKYTSGEATLEETNAALKEAGSNMYLDPNKNKLTEEEIRATTIGTYPDQANGYGMLDTGTGSLDKVEVKNGQLVNCDCGSMYALCIIADRIYKVEGTKLVEYKKD